MKTTILGWNPINDGCGWLKASVFIKPTLEMLRFFNRSVFHRGVVRVVDSNSCYDGPNRFATIDKSADVPNCRQNFYNATGLYVITLDTQWQGYPLKNGTLEFQEGIVNEIVDFVDPKDNSLSALNLPSCQSTPSNLPVICRDELTDEIENSQNIENIDNIENIEMYEKERDKQKKSCAMDNWSLMLAALVILFFLCNSMMTRRR